ncbi:MAG: hypothetical protein Q4F72_06960 [Desulfovibrionaceae bacterium]|nr:hypothetical protein [Desulfovibrionaceae bacterium]
MSLLINEVFWSVQGEGRNTGLPSVFIRLQGCDVRCPWCDTGYSLDRNPRHRLPDCDPAVFAKTAESPEHTAASPEWLVGTILAGGSPVRHAVITGGEPFQQDIFPLADLLLSRGFSVQVETSGSRPVLCPAAVWVTLSPKRRKMPLPASWTRADEIKTPIENEDDLAFYMPYLLRLAPDRVALQPVSAGKEATELCMRTCMERNWRLSLQTHKLISVR